MSNTVRFSWIKKLIGGLIITNGLWWLVENLNDYYTYNYTIVRCGFGAPSNQLIATQCAFSLVSIMLGFTVTRGKMSAWTAGWSHSALIVIGVCCMYDGTPKIGTVG